MDEIIYTLDIGLPNERKVVLEKRPDTPHACYVDGVIFPGFPDLEDFARFCERVWHGMSWVYRRES